MPREKRKGKVFSVSMRESEVNSVDKFLKDVKRTTGLTLSRNQYIRKCALAHKKHVEEGVPYLEAFKSID